MSRDAGDFRDGTKVPLGNSRPLGHGGRRYADPLGNPGDGHPLAKRSIENRVSAHTEVLSMGKEARSKAFLSSCKTYKRHHAPMEIGDRIRVERRARGLTQQQLADAVGVDKSAVGQWESAASRKGISTTNLIQVAKVLAIPVSRLTGEEVIDDLSNLDGRERELIRFFRKMTPVQQDAHFNLFQTSAFLTDQEKPQRNPTGRKRIAG